MHALWHWILWLLAVTAHDPASIEAERARAAGCVNVAYSALATEPEKPAPVKDPAKPACRACDGSGKIQRPDGGYVRCKCNACPTGTCPKVLR